MLENDGIHLSLSTLRRRLKRLGLKRKGNVFYENQLKALVTEEIQGPGRLSGYRAIWHALRLRHGIHVSRHVVSRLLREIDPDGNPGKPDDYTGEYTQAGGQMNVGTWTV